MTDYSQWGEQAIIAAILAKLPSLNHWCVDVGAGDGVTLSNTRALIESGYQAILIEANPDKFDRLASLEFGKSEHVIAYNARVEASGEQSLDKILDRQRVPTDFDFLSIDIDGHDYHLWAGLKKYNPKAVCIEFNPTMSADLNYVQAPDGPVDTGSSLLAITHLGESKGYALAAVTATNAIFVRGDMPHEATPTMEHLWQDKRFMAWIFHDYEGNCHAIGHLRSPWQLGDK